QTINIHNQSYIKNISRQYHNYLLIFFFNDTSPTEIYTLSLHDALPIYHGADVGDVVDLDVDRVPGTVADHVVLLVLIDGNAGRLNVGINDPLTLDGLQHGGHLGIGGVHRVGRRGAPG